MVATSALLNLVWYLKLLLILDILNLKDSIILLKAFEDYEKKLLTDTSYSSYSGRPFNGGN